MRILLVEDDRGVADAVAGALRVHGHSTDRVARGMDALTGHRDADVLLLDLGLPDVDGLELLRRLRRVTAMPVIVLTARGDERSVVRGLRLGADDYLVKPVRLAELAAVDRPADSAIRQVADLRDKRISLGAPGSGAAEFGDRLLAMTGVPAKVEHWPLTEATEKLAAGRIDALLWSGGVPTPGLAELDREVPLRLLGLDGQLPALRKEYGPVYDRVSVPDNGYGDPRPVVTVGVPNLLVAGPALPDGIAAAVARVLVGRAPKLVPRQASGTQYLDRRSLPSTGRVPLHPGAAAAYRDLRG